MSRRPRRDPSRQLHGVLVLDKPQGPTSADCLDRVKRACGQGRIGHAGTLDPLATGVLVALLGQATKLSPWLLGAPKTYRGELLLGRTTDSYDIQGVTTGETDPAGVTEDQVREAVAAWKTYTTQIVPPISAAKHEGQPLHRLAREGKDVPIKEKDIDIFEAEVLSLDLPRLSFRVRSSAGVYVRSLVHSLGMRCGVGAVMTALTREASLPYTLEQAVSLETVLAEPDRLGERIIPLPEALPHWSRIPLDADQTATLKRGGRLPWDSSLAESGPFEAGRRAMFLDPEGQALGLVESGVHGGKPVWNVLRGLWEA